MYKVMCLAAMISRFINELIITYNFKRTNNPLQVGVSYSWQVKLKQNKTKHKTNTTQNKTKQNKTKQNKTETKQNKS